MDLNQSHMLRLGPFIMGFIFSFSLSFPCSVCFNLSWHRSWPMKTHMRKWDLQDTDHSRVKIKHSSAASSLLFDLLWLVWKHGDNTHSAVPPLTHWQHEVSHSVWLWQQTCLATYESWMSKLNNNWYKWRNRLKHFKHRLWDDIS